MKLKAATIYNTSVWTETASSKNSVIMKRCSLKQTALYMWLKS